MKSKKDYYKILGIIPSATSAEIRQAYLRLAVLKHPDRDPSPQATAGMQEINEAYGILGNAGKRIKYDFEYLNQIPLSRPNGSGSGMGTAGTRVSQDFFTQALKRPQIALILFVMAFLLILTGLLIESELHILGSSSHSAFSSLPATITPGPLSRPVCASYIQKNKDLGFTQGVWTDNLQATSSGQSCILWMESNVLNKKNCAEITAIEAKIVLIEKSRHGEYLPNNLNFKTELLKQEKCLTQ